MSDRDAEREQKGEWDAYSDFQHVSRRVSQIVVDATKALQKIESAKRSGEKLQSELETDLRTDVLTAVTLLRTELENERDTNETYNEILSRWEGEEGFIDQFDRMDAISRQPEPWLKDFAGDIHRAAWELGYLKAGSEQKETATGDRGDGEVRDVIEGMTR